MKNISGRIDVHHHLMPPAYVKVLQDKGIYHVAGAPLPLWTPEKSLEAMLLNGIQTAILSLSCPGTYFGDVQDAVSLSRSCNEYAAKLKTDNQGTLGYFAVLPMPFTEQSCVEASYALEVLGADGIVLMGSSDGVFLGDPKLDELMFELNKRKATVFIHPNLHATTDLLDLDIPGFFVEFLCDTTRASLNLVFSGTMEKHPDIKWILAHAGGFLPYIAWRASLGNLITEHAEKTPRGIMHYIRRFYYDTALSSSPFAMSALLQLVDTSHILFGSDFPFAPKQLMANQVQALEKLELFDDTLKYQVNRGNAINLFPQYKQDNEKVVPIPQYGELPLSVRLKRVATKPLLYMAERMRKR